MAVFSFIFVTDTKIVSGYNFVAPLTKCYSIKLSIKNQFLLITLAFSLSIK